MSSSVLDNSTWHVSVVAIVRLRAIGQCVPAAIAIGIVLDRAVRTPSRSGKGLPLAVDEHTTMANRLPSPVSIVLVRIPGIRGPTVAESVEGEVAFVPLIVRNRVVWSGLDREHHVVLAPTRSPDAEAASPKLFRS